MARLMRSRLDEIAAKRSLVLVTSVNPDVSSSYHFPQTVAHGLQAQAYPPASRLLATLCGLFCDYVVRERRVCCVSVMIV